MDEDCCDLCRFRAVLRDPATRERLHELAAATAGDWDIAELDPEPPPPPPSTSSAPKPHIRPRPRPRTHRLAPPAPEQSNPAPPPDVAAP